MSDVPKTRVPRGRPRSSPNEPAARASSLSVDGALVKLRRRQQLALAKQREDTLLLLHRGVALLTISPPARRRVVLQILYPEDLVARPLLPSQLDCALEAATPAELSRYRTTALVRGTAETEFDGMLLNALADQSARLNARIATLGLLTGDERAASCLLELALRTGRTAGSGLVFEMPLTRFDMADYLFLNADTLSRIMSRLADRGVIARLGGRQILCKDVDLLRAATPLGSALFELHRRV